MTTLTIAHLYPGEMNTYGDDGNVIALSRRLQWRGYGVRVVPVELGLPFDFTTADIVVGGGGQDVAQLRVHADLTIRGDRLRAEVKDGLPLLAVGGTYQLLGRSFSTRSGREIPGVGIFGATTRRSPTRLVGNVVTTSPFGKLVGFENHSGQTILHRGQTPLGQVVRGYGNNVERRQEGAITHCAVGTYLHGPVLPKNPVLADHLILGALHRRGLGGLPPLDDDLEQAARLTRLWFRPLPAPTPAETGHVPTASDRSSKG